MPKRKRKKSTPRVAPKAKVRVVRRRRTKSSPGQRAAHQAVGTTVTLASLPKILSILGK